LTPEAAPFKLVSTFENGSLLCRQQLQRIKLSRSITAPIAKAARFARGVPIKVEVVEGGVFIRAVGKPQLTLAQKLKAFDPAVHGGEVMTTGRVGAEVF
jgi:antitoxin MazE